MNLTAIDKNFATENVTEEDVEWHEITEPEFAIYGVYFDPEQDCYVRFPNQVAKQVSDRIEELNRYTAGGRIRFSTDSPYIAVKAVMRNVGIMRHQPIVGHYGFSLYLNNKYYTMFCPSYTSISYDTTKDVEYDEVKYVGNYFTNQGDMYDYTMFMPCYGGVKKLYIGLKAGSTIKKHPPYKFEKPVAYYGSSITQGGVASRAGNEYQGHISRWLDTNYFTFGFSGRAKGEQVMADYFASLDASIFVIDYDYNAPDPEHLMATHFNFYKTVRDKNPDTPIVMITRPNYGRLRTDEERRLIVEATYKTALENGDKNVYFIDGRTLFGDVDADACTVDGVHPNDLGFYRMAQAISPTLDKILNKKD